MSLVEPEHTIDPGVCRGRRGYGELDSAPDAIRDCSVDGPLQKVYYVQAIPQ